MSFRNVKIKRQKQPNESDTQLRDNVVDPDSLGPDPEPGPVPNPDPGFFISFLDHKLQYTY